MVSDLIRKKSPPTEKNTKSDDPLMIGYAGEADIKALFELLGLLAKSDGAVNPKEIQEVERVMTYHLAADQREDAKSCFRKGKEAQVVKGIITAREFQLYGILTDRWLEPIQIIDILLRLALIDGTFDLNEAYVIDNVRLTLGVHNRSYWVLRDTLAERWGVNIPREGASFAKHAPPGGESGQGTASPARTKKHSRAEALKILDLSENATTDEIKIAHRTLVKKFHPDLVEGRETSEEKIKEAALKFCEVQAAYEALMDG